MFGTRPGLIGPVLRLGSSQSVCSVCESRDIWIFSKPCFRLLRLRFFTGDETGWTTVVPSIRDTHLPLTGVGVRVSDCLFVLEEFRLLLPPVDSLNEFQSGSVKRESSMSGVLPSSSLSLEILLRFFRVELSPLSVKRVFDDREGVRDFAALLRRVGISDSRLRGALVFASLE